jgi:hypothetical protein
MDVNVHNPDPLSAAADGNHSFGSRQKCAIGATGQQASDRYILIERFPVQADAAQFDLLAFGRGCAQ